MVDRLDVAGNWFLNVPIHFHGTELFVEQNRDFIYCSFLRKRSFSDVNLIIPFYIPFSMQMYLFENDEK